MVEADIRSQFSNIGHGWINNIHYMNNIVCDLIRNRRKTWCKLETGPNKKNKKNKNMQLYLLTYYGIYYHMRN